MRWLLAMAIVAAVPSFEANAQSAIFTGADLSRACDDSAPAISNICSSWISGFLAGVKAVQVDQEGRKTPAATCIPREVLGSQAQLVIEKFMRENPEFLNFNASLIAYMALERAYPCAALPNR